MQSLSFNTVEAITTEIRTKIERYCAYQERCQEEVRRKLSLLGVRGVAAEWMIAELIAGRFINEERFARAFARGKFRINHWGRRKIEAALKAKKLSPACIRLGLGEISESDYRNKLKKLVEKPAVKHAEDARRRFRQLIAKGYEPALVSEFLNFAEDFPDNLP